MSSARKFVLLGATGSIGESTLKVLRKHPDKLSLVGVSARTQAAKLHSIVEEFDVSNAHLGTIPSDLTEFPKTTNLGHSLEDLEALASLQKPI